MNTNESNGAQKKRVKGLIAYVVLGLLTTVALIGIKLAFEHSSYGHEFELSVFGWLQGSLSSIDTNNPVILLDISDVPGGKPTQPTPRKSLKEIIEAVANESPRAIAVDIDFSPKLDHYVTDADPEFFDFCLNLRHTKRVPIFLGVGERKSAPPDAWLGQLEYKDLAVAIAASKEDTSRLPLWVKPNGATEILNTMSYALALEYRKHLPEAPRWIGWAVKKNVEGAHESTEEQSEEPALVYSDRLVNYSKLDAMKLSAQKDLTAESIKQTGTRYKDKLVIIGDVESPVDFFPVPSRKLNEPGSLLHACATYTLIKEPLFEFKPSIRLLLDFGIALAIILAVAMIRYKNPEPSWVGKQAIFILLAIVIVFVGGVLLVKMAGVMWLDFLLVAFSLFMHPKVEHLFDKIALRLKRRRQPATEPTSSGASVLPAILAAGIMLSSGLTASGQESSGPCQGRVAAVVLKLHGAKKRTCYHRENANSAWQMLSNKSVMKQLLAGQDLYCDKGCSVVLLLCGTKTQYPVTQNPPKWYRVLNAYSAPIRLDPYKEVPGRKARINAPESPSTSPIPEMRLDSARSRNRPSDFLSREDMAGGARSTGATGATANANRAGVADRGTRSSERETRFLALLITGNKARETKDFPAAERSYAEAASLVPFDSRPIFGLGNVYLDTGKPEAAEAAYRRAIELEPRRPEAYVALAMVLMRIGEGEQRAGRLNDAESLLVLASILDPRNEIIYELLDELLERSNTDTEVIERVYRHAVAYSPWSFSSNLRLARLLGKIEKRDEARRYLRKAEELARTSEDLLLVAETLESQGHLKRAQRLVQRVLAKEPNNPRALFLLGRLQLSRKSYERSIKSLELASKATPDSFAALYLKGVAQARLGNLVAAEHAFDEAAVISPVGTDEPLALAYGFSIVGDAYAKGAKLSEAIRLYEKALGYDPEDEQIKSQLKEVRSRLNP